MGLFTKKDPCAICGGKVKGIFPWKIEGQLICKDCYGTVDLPEDVYNSLTIEAFNAYRQFREENAQLKTQFQVTKQVSLGVFRDKVVFDTNNRLFCLDSFLNKTIFEGSQIKSFTITEDGSPLYEGSADGLVCYTSNVPDSLRALSPLIMQMAMAKQMEREAERRARQQGNDQYISSVYYEDVPEPFKKFLIEIHCEHPYWTTVKAERDGPTFNNDHPSAQEYLKEYQEGAEDMGQLARALMEIAFPGAPEQRVNQNTMGQSAAAAASVDVVEEIQRFKSLLEQGVLTEEEFAAKKRRLLGI